MPFVGTDVFFLAFLEQLCLQSQEHHQMEILSDPYSRLEHWD